MKKNKLHSEIIEKDSREILQEINEEISLRAHRLSTSFLSDIFRSLFQVEKSLELIEPRVYTTDDDPGQIIFSRLNKFQVNHLPFAIMNDEVLCKNYKLFSDIDFVLFTDLSLSMIYRWSLTKDTFAQLQKKGEEIELLKYQSRLTKLYALKYVCAVFLYSAIKQSFKIQFIPFAEDMLIEKKSHKDPHFPAFVLDFIDDHFWQVYRKIVENPFYSENPGLINALMRALKFKKRSLVLLVSDFLDLDTLEAESLMPLLSELKLRHSLLIAVINDPYEIEIPPSKLRTRPLIKSWEHTKNIEQNIREQVILTNKNIEEYNRQANRRRTYLLDFLRDEKIHNLDVVTNQNSNIPEKLEKLNLEILQGL